MKFRNLKAEEIELRVGNVVNGKVKQGYTLLLYKNARADMVILDEVVGAENWQRKHYEVKDNMYCSVGIWDDSKKQWIWKDDCGTESNTEKEKGEASDSFKRACVNWGIGRELYTSPFIFISCELEGGKLPNEEKYRRFNVAKIEYEDNRIVGLDIVDNRSGEKVFSMKSKQKTVTAEKGGDYVFEKGKYANSSIKEVYKTDKGYLEFLLTTKGSNIVKAEVEKFFKELEK